MSAFFFPSIHHPSSAIRAQCLDVCYNSKDDDEEEEEEEEEEKEEEEEDGTEGQQSHSSFCHSHVAYSKTQHGLFQLERKQIYTVGGRVSYLQP